MGKVEALKSSCGVRGPLAGQLFSSCLIRVGEDMGEGRPRIYSSTRSLMPMTLYDHFELLEFELDCAALGRSHHHTEAE